MILALSTWPEIERWLQRNKTIIIPIGSNEQHGPTGLLGTDWLCPEIIAHEAHRRGGDILVAPTFNIGMAQHHLGFPGTISLRPSTFQATIADWVHSLSRHGFERIYFLNGHGGNIASIEAAFSEIYSAYSFANTVCPFMLKLKSWWQLPASGGLPKNCFPWDMARMPRRRKSPSRRARIPTPSRRSRVCPRRRPPGRFAMPWIIAPALRTDASVPTLRWRHPRRARA